MFASLRARLVAWCDAKLEPGWRRCYRWFSLQAAALQAAVLITWATLPDDLKTYLPSWLLPCIAIFVLVVGVIGRMTHQEDPPNVRSQ